MTAIKLSQRLARSIMAQHPGVADQYRSGRTYAEIARTIPGLAEAANSAAIAAGAVGYAVRGLIARDEQQRLLPEHLRASLARTVGGFGTEGAREFSRRAGRIRARKHGIDLDRLTRAKSYLPWSDEERESVLRLLLDPAYRHARGAGKGQPVYAELAEEINRRCHGGRPIRSSNSVKAMLARWGGRRAEGTVPSRRSDSTVS